MVGENTLPLAGGSSLVARKNMDEESVASAIVALSMTSSDTDEKSKAKAVMDKQSELTASQRLFYPGAHQIGGVGPPSSRCDAYCSKSCGTGA